MDGNGAVDYTGALAGPTPLKIERTLNAPTVCLVSLYPTGNAIPVRDGRVMVAAEDGTLLFSGYVVSEPERIFAGEGFAGAVYLLQVSALSDDVLLDRQHSSLATVAVSQEAAQVLDAMTTRAGGVAAGVTTQGTTAMIGSFTSEAGGSWSSNTSQLAAMARA